MGVIRVPRVENFTTMSNYHLKDKRLSLRAVGLMSRMLSLPDDWDYTVAGLAAICREGREAVRKVLQELEEAGYLVREQSRDGGHFAGYDYTLYEHPLDEAEETLEASPLPENLGVGASPLPENPLPENPPELNIYISNTQESIPPKPPKGARRVKAVCEYEPELFERFWKAYPRGDDKAGARREWDKLKPSRKLMKDMSAALARQKETDEWRRGIGIPYACRWLSHRRWEDEVREVRADEGSGRRAAEGVGPYEEAVEWV